MPKIALTQGRYAIVDEEDYERVSRFKWYAHREPRKHGPDAFYAQRQNGKKEERMHRVILGLTDPKVDVDHINRDGLDNRRCNLRAVTQSENSRNMESIHGSSKYKGVGFSKSAQKWQARITKDYKAHYLGLFTSEEDAARAYDAKAMEIFGEFARLNFVYDCQT